MKAQGGFLLINSGLNDASLAATCSLVSKYHPFFNYSFGLMVIKLTDQLKFKTNAMVVREGKLLAYAGWITVNANDAERWLNEGGDLPQPEFNHPNAAIVTITVTEHKDYLLPLMRAVSNQCQGLKIYRMRSLKNGEEHKRPAIRGKAEKFNSMAPKKDAK